MSDTTENGTEDGGLLDGLRDKAEDLKDKAVDALTDVKEKVEGAVEGVKDSLDADDRRTLQQMLEALMHEDDMIGLAIVGRDGALLARAGTLALPPSADTPPAAARRLRIVEPIRPRPLPADEATGLGAASDAPLNASGSARCR